MSNIRNFCIIAHIDHGKSTLADRMLEITATVPKREMRDQILDSMDLERERGITIKMQPVRMLWHPQITNHKSQITNKSKNTEIQNSKNLEFGNCDLEITDSEQYVLNLIDTPGHIDFSYEVSRALKAVEGAILLVDSTQGVQAQTISVLNMALEAGLTIIPAITKIDSKLARREEVKEEISKILNCDRGSILEVSGKTGQGVQDLLDKVIEKVPAPEGRLQGELSALVFDFRYSLHKGIIVYVRIMTGSVAARDALEFKVAGRSFVASEVGVFHPKEKAVDTLGAGEIGYIVTGIKEAGIASVGDTVGKKGGTMELLSGYSLPQSVVWASVYPENQNDFTKLRQSLERIRLADSALVFEEESSNILGKGFRAGFLGMLHLEIVSERLKREFDLNLIITSPSISYDVKYRNDKKVKIFSAAQFPDNGMIDSVEEPVVGLKIISPHEYLGDILKLLYEYEAEIVENGNFGIDRAVVEAKIPLRELMRNFFDKVKSVSKGYASLSYEVAGTLAANVTRLDILINGEAEPAFSRVVSRRIVEEEAERAVERLYAIMPRGMIAVKIQAKALGRIISSKTIPALRKDVTQHMYGGDITRKMKLREKQKKGKKKMQSIGRVSIPQEVFLKMIRPD